MYLAVARIEMRGNVVVGGVDVVVHCEQLLLGLAESEATDGAVGGYPTHAARSHLQALEHVQCKAQLVELGWLLYQDEHASRL